MSRKLSLILGVFAVAMPAACGGGGGSDEAPAQAVEVADKYVGTWVACAPSQVTVTAKRETLAFSKSSATKLVYAITQESYANRACSGSPQSRDFPATGTFTFTGTKVIDSRTVDKLIDAGLTPVADAGKDINLFSGTTLTFGKFDLALDTEGYLTALDTTCLYNKQ